MATSYSLDFAKRARSSKMKGRPLGQMVAQILASGSTGTSIVTLATRCRSSEARVSRYLQALEGQGLLRFENDEESIQTTSGGMRFLHLYESAQRLSAPISNTGRQTYYRTCLNCRPHPSFPDKHPITLHSATGVCLLCNEKS